MAFLDVVIVTYNSEDVILPCLSSLPPSLPHRSIKIIIIDNNSCDATNEKIRSFSQANLENIETVFLENAGNEKFTRGINQGVVQSDAEFVLFLNPDTVLPETGLQRLIEILQEDEKTGVVAPQLRNRNGGIQSSCRRLPQRRDVLFHALGFNLVFAQSRIYNGWKMGDFDHRIPCFVAQPQGAFLLTKRAVLQDVGKFDEQFPLFFSDVDWCRRVLQAGYRIRFSPEVAVFHHQGQAVNTHRTSSIFSSHKSFIRYFWKYETGIQWFIPNSAVTLLLIILGIFRCFAAAVHSLIGKRC